MTDDEAELLDLSMRNSFEVLINGLDAGEVIIQDFGYFAHDPSRVPTKTEVISMICLLYTSPSPRDRTRSRMPSSA